MQTAISVLTGALTAIATLFPLWLRYREVHGGEEARIKRQLDLLSSLPDDSAAKGDLQKAIDSQIQTMLKRQSSHSRNGLTIGIGIFMLGTALFLLAVAVARGGWWWIAVAPSLFVGLLGAVGLADGLKSGERTASGTLVRQPRQRKR